MTPAGGPAHGDHETYEELAVGWALHALEPEDEALLGRHLPDCARCARTIAETSEVMAALATDLPPAEPSPGLRGRIRSAVAETGQVRRPVLPFLPPVSAPDDGPARRPMAAPPATRPPATHPPATHPPATHPPATRRAASTWRPRRLAPRGWRIRMPQALAAAGAAVVVGLGVWNVVLSTSRQQAEQAAAEQQHVVDSLLTPGQATIAPLSDHDGHRVATVVARHGQIQVVTSGLPVDDEASTTYVLWGTSQGNPVALGTFDVVRPRLDLRTVGSDHTGLDEFSGYAISLEHGLRAPARPTDIVANGQVTR